MACTAAGKQRMLHRDKLGSMNQQHQAMVSRRRRLFAWQTGKKWVHACLGPERPLQGALHAWAAC